MYLEIMTTMIYKCIDYLFPMSGGVGGGVFMVNHVRPHADASSMLWMTWQQYCEATIMIVVGGLLGAFIGWIVKRWLDKLFPKKKKII